jgi:hypothetical protein
MRQWLVNSSPETLLNSKQQCKNFVFEREQHPIYLEVKFVQNNLDTCADDQYVKFIYSEKATNFCEISTVDLSYVVTVKSMVEISQNFVAFSKYMNFKPLHSFELK